LGEGVNAGREEEGSLEREIDGTHGNGEKRREEVSAMREREREERFREREK
jgi:hypothetical protein